MKPMLRRDCLILFAAPAVLRAQAPITLEALAAAQKTPGIAAAIRRRGEEVFSRALGDATPETRFRIGSLSKLLTAATAARLYERGALDLDAPVQKYLASFPVKDSPITARQLLGHLAGIRHYGPNEYFNTTHYASVAEALKIFQDSPLVQAPGTKYTYSSYGFNLLGAVIEGAAKLEFTACVQREVLDPLGMKNTGTDEHAAKVSRFYGSSNGAISEAPRVDNSDRIPSGGFLSTAGDLARFGAAHLSGEFLKPSTRALIFTSQKDATGKETGTGLGWRIARISGELVYHHGGDAMGGRAFLLLRPEHDVAVAVVCNLSFARIAENEAMALSQPFTG
jgi:CubicO group peptidase (beta-lactamase class C family)